MSKYLEYLPHLYHQDEFLKRFLQIFEYLLSPVEDMIESEGYLYDPDVAPSRDYLTWLATWVGLTLDARWPEDKRRTLIRNGVELCRWRGTRKGLLDYLSIYLNNKLYNRDNESTMQTTIKIEENEREFHFTVRVDNDADTELVSCCHILKQIIDAEKPAHTIYTLRVNGQDCTNNDRVSASGQTDTGVKK